MMNVGEFWGFHFSLNIALSLNYIVVKWVEDISHCKTIEMGLHVQYKWRERTNLRVYTYSLNRALIKLAVAIVRLAQ